LLYDGSVTQVDAPCRPELSLGRDTVWFSRLGTPCLEGSRGNSRFGFLRTKIVRPQARHYLPLSGTVPFSSVPPFGHFPPLPLRLVICRCLAMLAIFTSLDQTPIPQMQELLGHQAQDLRPQPPFLVRQLPQPDGVQDVADHRGGLQGWVAQEPGEGRRVEVVVCVPQVIGAQGGWARLGLGVGRAVLRYPVFGCYDSLVFGFGRSGGGSSLQWFRFLRDGGLRAIGLRLS